MKTRKFKIVIQPPQKTLDDAEKTFKLMAGKKIRHKEDSLTLCFSDFSMVPKVLSAERLKLLRTIKKDKPSSVNQLAKLLGRSQQNVHKDVHYLADLGIIDLKRARKNGSKKESVEPRFNWDGFDVAV